MSSALKYFKRKMKPLKNCVHSTKPETSPCSPYASSSIANSICTSNNSSNQTVNSSQETGFERYSIDNTTNSDESIEQLRRFASISGLNNQISPIYGNISSINQTLKEDLIDDELTGDSSHSLIRNSNKNSSSMIYNRSIDVPQHQYQHHQNDNNTNNTLIDNSSLTSFEEYASNETTATATATTASNTQAMTTNATSTGQHRAQYKSRFIRYNGPNSSSIQSGPNRIRMSKQIKLMFKNVVKYQMNAISCLEKFYEAQIYKLETDRRRNLALNPENSEFIQKFYDKQLAELEERVYSNLTYICRNRCTGTCINTSCNTSSMVSSSTFKRQYSLPFKHKMSTTTRKRFKSASSIRHNENDGGNGDDDDDGIVTSSATSGTTATATATTKKILTNGSLKQHFLFSRSNSIEEGEHSDLSDGFFNFNFDNNQQHTDFSSSDNSTALTQRRHTYGPNDQFLIELKRQKQLNLLRETQV